MIKVLVGPNVYARNQALKEMSAKHEQTVRHDGKEISPEQLLQELGGQSLFSESNLVVVDNLSENSAATEKIEDIIDASTGGNDLVLIESKLDKRKKYYKTLKKQTDIVACEHLNPDQAAKFVQDYVKQQDSHISASAARHLVERIGANQQLLASELDKLIIADQEITSELIDKLSPASLEDSAFALTDALAAGQTKQAIEIYRQLKLGGAGTPDIMGVLAWQLEIVALIVASPTSNQQAVARQTGLHPFVVKKNWRLSSGLEMSTIRQVIEEMLEADISIKSTKTPDDEIVEDLLIRLSAQLSKES